MGKRGPEPNKEVRGVALALRLEGRSFSEIAKAMGLSPQRVQQLLSPPKEVREVVVNKAKGFCQRCGILVGSSGHVHHRRAKGTAPEDYNDLKNLRLLCSTCHRYEHSVGPDASKRAEAILFETQNRLRVERRDKRRTGQRHAEPQGGRG